MAEEIERLLIVQPHGIGDVIMMTPVLAGLRDAAPRVKLALLTRSVAARDLVSDVIDEGFVLDRRSVSTLESLSLLVRIKRDFCPDACIVAPHVSAGLGQLSAWLVGARVRVGSHNAMPAAKYTHTNPGSLRMHKTDGMLALARILFPNCAAGKSTCAIDEDSEQRAAEIAQQLELGGRALLGIHPGTDDSGTMRRYSPQYFHRVIGSFRRRYDGGKVLVFLGPNEKDLAATFAGQRGVDVVTDQPMGVTAALIRRTHAFLGSDSALVHVAAALGVPTVTIF